MVAKEIIPIVGSKILKNPDPNKNKRIKIVYSKENREIMLRFKSDADKEEWIQALKKVQI